MIKKFWEVVNDDFYRMVAEFHKNERLAKGCNASFLVLIPKRDNPVGLNDYRPISLVGCLYKVLAKLLAGRLSKVMESVISGNQTAIVKGRNIMDGVVVVNEILDYAKKRGNCACCSKSTLRRPTIRSIESSWTICSLEWGLTPSGGLG